MVRQVDGRQSENRLDSLVRCGKFQKVLVDWADPSDQLNSWRSIPVLVSTTLLKPRLASSDPAHPLFPLLRPFTRIAICGRLRTTVPLRRLPVFLSTKSTQSVAPRISRAEISGHKMFSPKGISSNGVGALGVSLRKSLIVRLVDLLAGTGARLWPSLW